VKVEYRTGDNPYGNKSKAGEKPVFKRKKVIKYAKRHDANNKKR